MSGTVPRPTPPDWLVHADTTVHGFDDAQLMLGWKVLRPHDDRFGLVHANLENAPSTPNQLRTIFGYTINGEQRVLEFIQAPDGLPVIANPTVENIAAFRVEFAKSSLLPDSEQATFPTGEQSAGKSVVAILTACGSCQEDLREFIASLSFQ